MHCNLTHITIPLIFLLISQSAFSQNGRDRAVKDLKKFKGTEMLVVLYDGDELYNTEIKDAVSKYWTITPYSFIPQNELRNYAFEEEYSMLVRNDAKRVIHRVGRTDHIQSNHLAIYVCGKGDNLMNYTGQNALSQIHFKDINDTESYSYKLKALVQHMHEYLSFLEEKKITEDNHAKELRLFNTQEVKKLSGMTLYILKEELPEKLNDLEKLRKFYEHEVEIVGKEEIQAAIATQNGNVAFLHLDPRIKNLYVISAQGGKILYQAPTQDWGTLKGKDFSTLSRVATK